jgi:hypothetical protein
MLCQRSRIYQFTDVNFSEYIASVVVLVLYNTENSENGEKPVRLAHLRKGV